jgi:predicted nucleotidyltransferase
MNMNAAIDDKATFYSRRLRERLGDNIKQIILFGSRARGDYHQWSDYDFVIIVAHKSKNVRETITEVAVEFLNRYEELSANIVFDENEWQRQQSFPLGINVEREGVYL